MRHAYMPKVLFRTKPMGSYLDIRIAIYETVDNIEEIINYGLRIFK